MHIIIALEEYISDLCFRCVSVTFLELPIIVGSSSVTQLNPM